VAPIFTLARQAHPRKVAAGCRHTEPARAGKVPV